MEGRFSALFLYWNIDCRKRKDRLSKFLTHPIDGSSKGAIKIIIYQFPFPPPPKQASWALAGLFKVPHQNKTVERQCLCQKDPEQCNLCPYACVRVALLHSVQSLPMNARIERSQTRPSFSESKTTIQTCMQFINCTPA